MFRSKGRQSIGRSYILLTSLNKYKDMRSTFIWNDKVIVMKFFSVAETLFHQMTYFYNIDIYATSNRVANHPGSSFY